MKKIFLPIFLVIAAVVYVVVARANYDVLADEPSLTVYPNGMAMIQVPYRRDAPQGSLTVRVDEQEVFTAVPARPRKYWNSNYFFRSTGSFSDTARIDLAFEGKHDQALTRTVHVKVSSGEGMRMDFSGVAKPEESMREGEAMSGAQAGIREVDVPDLTQRPAECAPTAAANSLISLAREHGADDKLPADALTMVNELKGDMRWTPADGVVPADFIRGKNEWAAKKGLPIVTASVGNSQGIGSLEAIREGLAVGKAAELRIRFAEPTTGGKYKIAGGHLITVVGVTETPNGTFIDVNDPRTPDGTETYRVENGQIENYPLWPDGPVLIGLGFTQTWTGVELDSMTDREVEGIREFAGEKRMIKALHLGARYIPLDQVHVSPGHVGTCEQPHWHANTPGSTRDTEGKIFAEIHQYCGYGKMNEVPVVDVELP
jgi:hypothetical protein